MAPLGPTVLAALLLATALLQGADALGRGSTWQVVLHISS